MLAKEATRVNEAFLKRFATAKAPFPKMPDSFKPLAEAFDVATPPDVEEEEEKLEGTVIPPGTIRVKADGLKQDIVIGIAFEPKEVDIVDHDHDSPSIGLNVLDISAVEHECEHDASMREAEEMVMSERSNIERDDQAAGNRLTKVRFDMSADFWGQTEEQE